MSWPLQDSFFHSMFYRCPAVPSPHLLQSINLPQTENHSGEIYTKLKVWKAEYLDIKLSPQLSRRRRSLSTRRRAWCTRGPRRSSSPRSGSWSCWCSSAATGDQEEDDHGHVMITWWCWWWFTALSGSPTSTSWGSRASRRRSSSGRRGYVSRPQFLLDSAD